MRQVVSLSAAPKRRHLPAALGGKFPRGSVRPRAFISQAHAAADAGHGQHQPALALQLHADGLGAALLPMRWPVALFQPPPR